MTTFETSAEMGIIIPDRELRGAKREIEQSIGSVTVDVDANQTSGGTSTTTLAGGTAAIDELGEQTDYLEDIYDELEKIGASGGFGGGGAGGAGGGGGGGGILDTILGYFAARGAIGAVGGGGGLLSGAAGLLSGAPRLLRGFGQGGLIQWVAQNNPGMFQGGGDIATPGERIGFMLGGLQDALAGVDLTGGQDTMEQTGGILENILTYGSDGQQQSYFSFTDPAAQSGPLAERTSADFSFTDPAAQFSQEEEEQRLLGAMSYETDDPHLDSRLTGRSQLQGMAYETSEARRYASDTTVTEAMGYPGYAERQREQDRAAYYSSQATSRQNRATQRQRPRLNADIGPFQFELREGAIEHEVHRAIRNEMPNIVQQVQQAINREVSGSF